VNVPRAARSALLSKLHKRRLDYAPGLTQVPTTLPNAVLSEVDRRHSSAGRSLGRGVKFWSVLGRSVLILASASPRRQELLKNAGIPFTALPAEIDEAVRPGETAEAYVRRLSREKALTVARMSWPRSLVLGADTTVEIDGKIVGKPESPESATRILRRLSGKSHLVRTGICLVSAPDRTVALEAETTTVTFQVLSDEEIHDYVASREPFDRAGAYAIQGLGSRFVRRIEGCYFNVCGLPVPLVYRLLRSLKENDLPS
jgi:septum formation protein